ncbi:unnamed protein product [Musa acuminata var. zebrina]
MEDRELTKPDYSDSLITIPAAPSEVTGLNFHSEQGSNSFGYTDIGWELEAKMPDITSILALTITEGNEPESFDDISLWKKVKPNNFKEAVPAEENAAAKLSEELSAYEIQTIYEVPP